MEVSDYNSLGSQGQSDHGSLTRNGSDVSLHLRCISGIRREYANDSAEPASVELYTSIGSNNGLCGQTRRKKQIKIYKNAIKLIFIDLLE